MLAEIGGGVTELGVVKAETESDSSSSKIRGRLEVGGKISSSDSSSVTQSGTTAGLSIKRKEEIRLGVKIREITQNLRI